MMLIQLDSADALQPNANNTKFSIHSSRESTELLLPVDLESRLLARSPFTQCLRIQGCFCTWSRGIRFSGSRTRSYKWLEWERSWSFRIRLTLFIKSLASELTKGGIVISALAILLCVITGVSSKGASPTKNS